MAPWYQTVRRRIAPMALILALGLVARDACNRRRHEPVTLRFELGPAPHMVRSLSVDVVADGEVIGRLRRAGEAASLGAPQLSLPLPDGEAELVIELEFESSAAAPARKALRRTVHAPHGAVVTVPLADEIGAPLDLKAP